MEDNLPTPSTTSQPLPKIITSTGLTNSSVIPDLATNYNDFYKLSSSNAYDIIAETNGINEVQFESWSTKFNDRYFCLPGILPICSNMRFHAWSKN